MTVTAPALVTAALLAGGALLVASGPAPGPVSGPAAVADSPRPTAASPAPGTAPPRAVGYGWPLSPRPPVLRGFAVGPFRWSPGHRGVDLGIAPGQAVLAAAEGRVVFAGPVAGRPVVVISHPDGLRTTYEPVVGVLAPGTAVQRGDVIGRPTTAVTPPPARRPACTGVPAAVTTTSTR